MIARSAAADTVRFRLIDIHGRDDGEVIWDRARGAVSGSGARTLMLSLDAAVANGGVTFGGLPKIPIADPLHEARDMAVVVAGAWQLPPELAPHFPKQRPGTPSFDAPGVVF